MKRFEIQTLRGAGIPVSEVAVKAGVSERSVERVAKEPPVGDPAAVDEAASKKMGRPSKVAEFESRIEQWLKGDPGLKTNQVLERLRDEGYEGSKSAAYSLVKALRKSAPTKAVARFEGLPGEFSQHDFGTVWVRYQGGSREKVKFLVSTMKYSRLRRVLIVANEQTETLCHALVDAFEYFEGVPLISVFDNPKTIVAKRDGNDVKWNETFGQFCTEAKIIPHATWPRRPQEKGQVENSVGYVKTSFFKAHVFKDREDMLERLAAWHVRVNDERPSRATGEIPRMRHLLEKPRLRDLGVAESGFRLRYTRVVRTDGFTEFDGIRYYAGERWIGNRVTLHVDKDVVAIHAGGECEAVHPRTPVGGRKSVLPTQRDELISKPGARPFLKRELLLDLCPAASWVITEIRHKKPDLWEAEVSRLFELLGEFEEEAMRDAFIQTAKEGLVGADYIEAILRGHAASAEVRS